MFVHVEISIDLFHVSRDIKTPHFATRARRHYRHCSLLLQYLKSFFFFYDFLNSRHTTPCRLLSSYRISGGLWSLSLQLLSTPLSSEAFGNVYQQTCLICVAHGTEIPRNPNNSCNWDSGIARHLVTNKPAVNMLCPQYKCFSLYSCKTQNSLCWSVNDRSRFVCLL
jgi:hypothetical protein